MVVILCYENIFFEYITRMKPFGIAIHFCDGFWNKLSQFFELATPSTCAVVGYCIVHKMSTMI